MPVQYIETTIVSTTRIRVWAKDGELSLGGSFPCTPEPSAVRGTRYYDAVNDYYYIIWGANKDYRRKLGTRPDAYLNRVAADVAANWTITGASSPTVTAVYRHSDTNKGGMGVSGAGYGAISQAIHHIDLDLSAPLVQGTYTITPPVGSGLAAYTWLFNDRTTIVEGFRVGHGFRPDDPYKKISCVSPWSWGGVTDPALATIELINSIGSTCATVTATQRATPTSGGTREVIDYRVKRKVASVTPGVAGTNRVVFTSPHGYSGGEVMVMTKWNFAGLSFPTNSIYPYNWPTVSVIDSTTVTTVNRQIATLAGTVSVGAGGTAVTGVGTSFTTTPVIQPNEIIRIAGQDCVVSYAIDDTHLVLAAPHTAGASGVTATRHVNATIDGTWSPGAFVDRMDGVAYGVMNTNGAGVYVYDADFSSLSLPVNTYRGRIPGLGVSRTFRIDHNVHRDVLEHYMFGVYHHLNGVAFDGRGGFTQPASFVDGSPRNAYWSKIPVLQSPEGATAYGDAYILYPDTTHVLTSERIAPGKPLVFLQDAGDKDGMPHEHHTALVDAMALFRKQKARASSPSFNSIPSNVFPQVSEVLGSGYADLDGIHPFLRLFYMVLETYRISQRVNGEVPSGFGVIAPFNFGGGFTENGSVWDISHGPMYINDEVTPFAYAFDVPIGYITKAAFFALADLLNDAGNTTRANEFITAGNLLLTRLKQLDPLETGNNTAIYDYYENTLQWTDRFMPNRQVYYLGDTPRSIVSVDAVNDTVTAADFYGDTGSGNYLINIADGSPVAFASPPTGLNETTVYYIRRVSAGVYSFYDTEAHALAFPSTTGRIDITGTQTGGRWSRAMTSAQVRARVNTLTSIIADCRNMAHGLRYLATGASDSKTVIEGATLLGPHSLTARGLWAWHERDTANPTRRGQVYDMIYTFDFNNGAYYRSDQTFNSAYAFDHYGGNGRQVWKGGNDLPHMAWGYMLNPAEAVIQKAIIAQINTETGANPLGVSNIVGLGHRWWNGNLSLDTSVGGFDPPKGFAAYVSDIAWGYSNGSDATVYRTDANFLWSADSAAVTLADDNHYKQVEPLAWAKPFNQQHEDLPNLVYVNEGRHTECELPGMISAMCAHMRGDNTATAPSANGYLMRCRAA